MGLLMKYCKTSFTLQNENSQIQKIYLATFNNRATSHSSKSNNPPAIHQNWVNLSHQNCLRNNTYEYARSKQNQEHCIEIAPCRRGLCQARWSIQSCCQMSTKDLRIEGAE